jgi:hypothetical protein
MVGRHSSGQKLRAGTCGNCELEPTWNKACGPVLECAWSSLSVPAVWECVWKTFQQLEPVTGLTVYPEQHVSATALLWARGSNSSSNSTTRKGWSRLQQVVGWVPLSSALLGRPLPHRD